ncbi:hypothetical protein KJ682_17165 [bacterium]|nr:hypothetical protein [bacterium]
MSDEFQFTPAQRREIVKLLPNNLVVPNLEADVAVYRTECANRIPPSEIRDYLDSVKKHAKALRKAITFLSKGHRGPNEWLIDPVREAEHYADALLKYRFSYKLKGGRLPHTPEIHLVQKVALIWEQIHGKPPGRGRGPFSKLIGRLLKYSGVEGAPTKYPHEVVAEALPPNLPIGAIGDGYPFAPIDPSFELPPLKRKAEDFFSGVLWVTNGSPTAFAITREKGGKTY